MALTAGSTYSIPGDSPAPHFTSRAARCHCNVTVNNGNTPRCNQLRNNE
jgi:hypothetical protein